MILKAPGPDASMAEKFSWPTTNKPGFKYIGYWTGWFRQEPADFSKVGYREYGAKPYEQRMQEWREECEVIRTFPDPQDYVGEWDPHEKEAVLAYLRAGKTHEQWRGVSFCRFYRKDPDSCEGREIGVWGGGTETVGPEMGSRCMTDGEWVWPEGLAHYVEKHNVVLPPDFIDKAVAKAMASCDE